MPNIINHNEAFINRWLEKDFKWKDSKDIEFVKQTIGHRNLDTTSAYVNKLSDQERQKRIDQLE